MWRTYCSSFLHSKTTTLFRTAKFSIIFFHKKALFHLCFSSLKSLTWLSNKDSVIFSQIMSHRDIFFMIIHMVSLWLPTDLPTLEGHFYFIAVVISNIFGIICAIVFFFFQNVLCLDYSCNSVYYCESRIKIFYLNIWNCHVLNTIFFLYLCTDYPVVWRKTKCLKVGHYQI
jgi:hypothetical protein